jgi:peptidoglycan/LPS O-acetylase OafA/YrhL
MRIVLLSFLTAFFALSLGVVAHHTITTGRFEVGLTCLIAVSIGSPAILAFAVRGAKTDSRWWPRILSALLLLLVAWAYLQLVGSPDFPTSLKIAHAIACVVLVIGALLVLSRRTKNA